MGHHYAAMMHKTGGHSRRSNLCCCLRTRLLATAPAGVAAAARRPAGREWVVLLPVRGPVPRLPPRLQLLFSPLLLPARHQVSLMPVWLGTISSARAVVQLPCAASQSTSRDSTVSELHTAACFAA